MTEFNCYNFSSIKSTFFLHCTTADIIMSDICITETYIHCITTKIFLTPLGQYNSHNKMQISNLDPSNVLGKLANELKSNYFYVIIYPGIWENF